MYVQNNYSIDQLIQLKIQRQTQVNFTKKLHCRNVTEIITINQVYGNEENLFHKSTKIKSIEIPKIPFGY